MYCGSMCCDDDDRHPVAYAIRRTEHDANGYHERRYSSVERHLRVAPPPVSHGKRYPKKHSNREKHYPQKKNATLWEYPTMDYPYSEQNAKGRVWRQGPDGRRTEFSPGYTRTITDSKKKIQGVSYHPYNDPISHVRADEIYAKKSRRR